MTHLGYLGNIGLGKKYASNGILIHIWLKITNCYISSGNKSRNYNELKRISKKLRTKKSEVKKLATLQRNGINLPRKPISPVEDQYTANMDDKTRLVEKIMRKSKNKLLREDKKHIKILRRAIKVFHKFGGAFLGTHQVLKKNKHHQDLHCK